MTEDDAHDFALLQLELEEVKAERDALQFMADMLAEECGEAWQAAEEATQANRSAPGAAFVGSPPSDR